MNFVRSEAGLRKNCRLGPREQFNQVSSTLDAGTVYSNSPKVQDSLRYLAESPGSNRHLVILRLYKKGLMKTLPVFSEFNMMDMMPLRVSIHHHPSEPSSNPLTQLEEPDEGCIRPSEDVFCFLAGDTRANEQTVSCRYIMVQHPGPLNKHPRS